MDTKLTLSTRVLPAEDVRQPEHIEFERWAHAPAEKRLPAHSVVMAELHDKGALCVVFDVEAETPRFLFTVERGQLDELARLVTESNQLTPLIVRIKGALCPPFCGPQFPETKSGVDNKGNPGTPGSGGTDPGLLVARVAMAWRALNAPVDELRKG